MDRQGPGEKRKRSLRSDDAWLRSVSPLPYTDKQMEPEDEEADDIKLVAAGGRSLLWPNGPRMTPREPGAQLFWKCVVTFEINLPAPPAVQAPPAVPVVAQPAPPAPPPAGPGAADDDVIDLTSSQDSLEGLFGASKY